MDGGIVGSMPEKFTSALESLPQKYREFIRIVLEEIEQFAEPEAELILELLQHPEKIKHLMLETLAELEQFEVKLEAVSDGRITFGYQVIEKFFRAKASELKRRGVVGALTGSLRYGDPVNLDFDIDFITASDNDDFELTVIGSWSDQLNTVWQHIGSEGHLSLVSLSELESSLELLEYGKIDGIERRTERLLYIILTSTSILSGNCDFGQDQEMVKSYREKVLYLADKYPLCGAIMVACLYESVRIRRERRGGNRN